MEATTQVIRLTKQQRKVLELLYKFRFVSAPLLAQVMGIRRISVYEVLEYLVKLDLVTKIYEDQWRIDRKPAQYYLNKRGVTAVRKVMDVKESIVHALYKNDIATDILKEHCLTVLATYIPLKQQLSPDTTIFTKTQLSRFREFPKNRPDLYVRTPDNQEAIILFLHDTQPRIINQRLEEILTHFDEEGWSRKYPTIAFVFKDTRTKNTFLFKTRERLDNMGMDEDEIRILATSLDSLKLTNQKIWANAFEPLKTVNLL